MKAAALVMIGAIAVACVPANSPSTDRGTCSAACARLEQLGCPEGKPTPRGATCVEACTEAEANGVSWGTGCLAMVGSCEAARRCGR